MEMEKCKTVLYADGNGVVIASIKVYYTVNLHKLLRYAFAA